MKKYIIAFDLDGTVLPEIDKIDERTINAVKRARALGHIPIITSARNYGMFRWVYEAMELDTPISAMNGAFVYNPSDPTFLPVENSIDSGRVKELLSAVIAEDADSPMYIEYKDTLRYTDGFHTTYYSERIKYSKPAIEIERGNIPDTPASRIIITPPSIEAAERINEIAMNKCSLRAEMYDFVPAASSAGTNNAIRMSFCAPGVDKWNALEMIAGRYGVANEDIFAFGDMWNDFGMLEHAGRSYALLGSEAARESKAKFVTRYTCEECGVADVIEREILGEG